MSPESMGVTRCLAWSTRYPGSIRSAPFASYDWKRPLSRARESRVLSTPKKTSPCGLSLVRIALLTACPASPSLRTLTLYPDCFSNAAWTPFETAHESWLTRVTVLEAVGEALPPSWDPQADRVSSPSPTARAVTC